MTAREAAYLVKSELTKEGFMSSNDKFPARRILRRLKAVLSTLKHRNLAKGIEFTPSEIFTLDCIEFEEVDRVSCPSIPPSGITWKRSVHAIPPFLKIISIDDILGNQPISIVKWNAVNSHHNSRNKLVAESPIATFKNVGDNIHLFVATRWDVISMTFVPDDYTQAVLFPRCGSESKKKCNLWDIEIGANSNLIEEAVKYLVAEELKINQATTPDIVNNDNPLT